MAFNRKDLAGNVGVGGGLTTNFNYKTADAKATVIGAGYFNGSADVLEVNDVIMTEASDGFVLYRVSANDGSVVTVVVGQGEV